MNTAAYAIVFFLTLTRYNANIIDSKCQKSGCPAGLFCADDNNDVCNSNTKIVNCRCKSVHAPGLLVTNRLNNIGPCVYSVQLALDGTPSQSIIWSYEKPYHAFFLSVDVDNKLQQAYLYDIFTKTIKTNPNYNLGPSIENVWTILHKGLSPNNYVKLAVDWVSHNIYWTDPEFKWIMVQKLIGNDKSMFRVLIHENLEGPHALALDPYEALIFWSDIGTFTKIEVSSLSGRNRRTLIASNLVRPYSMAADYEDQRLYFIDAHRHTVETVTYEGADRKIVVAEQTNFVFDIKLYKGYLYVTDFRNKQLFYINKTNGNVLSMNIQEKDDGYHGIAVVNPDIQPSSLTDQCVNHKCQHICLTEKNGVICICKDGYNLNEDNKTCSLTSKYSKYFHRALVYSSDSSICVVDIRVLSDFDFDPVCVLETAGTKYMVLDTDRRNIIIANDTAIYWTSVDDPNLHQLTKPSGIISGLAWDGYDRNVYWTEKNTGKICFTSIERDHEEIFIESLTNPRDIMILPHERLVYWISEIDRCTIESANIDGSNRHVIRKSDSRQSFKSLSYEPKSKRIYFVVTEPRRQTFVMSCKLNGSDMKYVIITGEELQGLDIFKGYSLVTAKLADETVISSYSLYGGEKTTYRVFPATETISVVKVFDENDRQNETASSVTNVL